MIWSPEQAIAFAPDAASAKAGRQLAAPAKWSGAGRSARALWGACQGSGMQPYRTWVELAEPAFKCSCPSQKFPCKHALGLMLLAAATPTAVPEQAEPQDVTQWLDQRVARAGKRKAAPSAAGGEDSGSVGEADGAARKPSKSEAARETKIAAGIADLETWLGDLARAGLADAAGRPEKAWRERAARLHDAQAPGLARAVQRIGDAASSGPGWQGRMLEQMGLLTLLLEGYHRQGELPAGLRADLRALVGWTQTQANVLAGEVVADVWLVTGVRVTEEEMLTTQRVWLWGLSRRRWALVLNFAAYGQTLAAGYACGSALAGELCYYESAAPLRAVFRDRSAVDIDLAPALADFPDIAACAGERAGRLAAAPWTEVTPLALSGLRVAPNPAPDGAGLGSAGWSLVGMHLGGDVESATLLPLAPSVPAQTVWRMIACAGGQPMAITGEWDGRSVMPLAVGFEGRLVPL